MIQKELEAPRLEDRVLNNRVKRRYYSPKTIIRNLAAWGARKMRKNGNGFSHEVGKVFGTGFMSLYYGDLLPSKQIKYAKLHGFEDPCVWSKYSTTFEYVFMLGVEQTPLYGLFKLPEVVGIDYGEDIFYGFLTLGTAVNFGRAYFAFVKKQPTPAISLKSLVMNGIEKVKTGFARI
jgi:hypothetical protein